MDVSDHTGGVNLVVAAGRIFIAILPFTLVVIAVMVVGDAVDAVIFGKGILDLVFIVTCAYFAQTAALRGLQWYEALRYGRRYWSFLWRSIAAYLAVVLLAVVVASANVLIFGSEVAMSLREFPVLVLSISALALVVLGGMFSVLGTWWPAAIADGNRRFDTALRRGRATRGYVFWRAASVLVAIVALQQVVPAFIYDWAGRSGLSVSDPNGATNWAVVFGWALEYCLVACGAVALSIILARAYLRAEATELAKAVATFE